MSSEKLGHNNNVLKGDLGGGFDILTGSTGEQTDLGIARRFGGSAAAYSLRDIGAINGPVVNVRRDVDGDGTDKEEDFSANQVQSGALEDWVNGKLESTLPADVDTAAAAYSLRKVKADYSGEAVRIRRSSDDVEVDVAFDSDDKVSLSSAITNVAEQGGESGQTTATTLGDFLGQTSITTGVAEMAQGDSSALSNATTTGFTLTQNGSLIGAMFPFSSNIGAGTKVTMTFTLSEDSGNASSSFRLFSTTGLGNAGSPSTIERASSGTYTIEFEATDEARGIGFFDNVSGSVVTISNASITIENSAFVHTWYDQAGSNDAVQETAANQPKIAEGGALLADGIDFDGSNDELRTSTNIASSQPVTVFSVTKPDAVNKRIFESITNSVRAFYGGSSQTGMNAGNTLLGSTNEISTNTEYLQTHLFNTTNSKVFLNNVETISGDAGSNAFAGNFSLGGSSAVFDGTMKELIVYTSDQSDNRFKIESNINNYYGLYNDANELSAAFDSNGTITNESKDGFTADVATFSHYVNATFNNSVATGETIYVSFNAQLAPNGGTSASPILRLQDAQVGSNTSNQSSISEGFNSIDLTATGTSDRVGFLEQDDNVDYIISDFKVSRIARNGFVETLYDQSSNGNDVDQGTAGSQPAIVKNGGQVKVRNRASIKFDGTDDFLERATYTQGALAQINTIFSVAKLDTYADENRKVYDGHSSTARNMLFLSTNGNGEFGHYAGTVATTGEDADANQHLFTSRLNGTASRFYIDGVQKSTSNTGSFAMQGITIGANHDQTTNNCWKGDIQEIIVYNSDQNDDRANQQDDINNYYTIY